MRVLVRVYVCVCATVWLWRIHEFVCWFANAFVWCVLVDILTYTRLNLCAKYTFLEVIPEVVILMQQSVAVITPVSYGPFHPMTCPRPHLPSDAILGPQLTFMSFFIPFSFSPSPTCGSLSLHVLPARPSPHTSSL